MLGDRPLASEDRSAAALYVPAILAGLVAAIAGGVAWGLIVKSTDYEIGFAAWGLGFLTGFAVLTATRGARGLPLQAIAIVCALLGILLGKYLAFVWVLQESAEDLNVSVFSSRTFDLFRDNLDIVFDWIDLLWVGFAVYTAWRALQPEEPKPVETQTKAEPPAA
jgi:hypothetical protein